MKRNYKLQHHQHYIIHLIKCFFYITSITTLALQLPLSFTLFARFNTSSIATISSTYNATTNFFLHAHLPILHVLVSFISVSGVSDSLTGYIFKPSKCIAWLFICLFQLCVGFGSQATSLSTFSSVSYHNINSPVMWIKRTILYTGLYKTMQVWVKMIVKPLVDDTLFQEEAREERSSKVVISAAFAALWMWRLQNDIEPMVLYMLEKNIEAQIGHWGYVLWLICNTVIITGMIAILKWLLFSGELLFFSSRDKQEDEYCAYSSSETEVV